MVLANKGVMTVNVFGSTGQNYHSITHIEAISVFLLKLGSFTNILLRVLVLNIILPPVATRGSYSFLAIGLHHVTFHHKIRKQIACSED